jgi:Spx/MgsR family transcriptional regulator
MSKLRVYQYEKCSTCRSALKFLAREGIDHEAVPILAQPPTRAELNAMLAHVGGDVRRLFNTSGQAYRELGLSEKLPRLSVAQAIALLAGDGRLVKRPFALGKDRGVVGFREEEWRRAFS